MNAHGIVLEELIEQYLARQRALGRDYRYGRMVLISLGQFLFKQRAADLDQTQFDAWCHTLGRICVNHRRKRQQIVRRFCLYRQRTEPTCFIPDASRFPRLVPWRAPVIFGESEVTRMLAAAEQLQTTPQGPLRPAVMRLAVVLLYTAGLRIGELARLKLGDVDVDHGVLRIHESKFHRSRWVPLSADARQSLEMYLKQRLVPPFEMNETSPLLCNWANGFRGYSSCGLREGIQTLYQMANVRGTDGRQPRVHDMRHVFALEALVRWYRQGVDVQSQLPKLALYMGHVSIVSTAYYLKWIPALAEVASRRFEAHFGYLIDGGTL
jgi:integrase/recombinase XerD